MPPTFKIGGGCRPVQRTAIAVRSHDAQKALEALIEQGRLDDSRRISRTEREVQLPVTEPPETLPFDFEVVEQQDIVPRRYPTPMAEIRARIQEELPAVDPAALPESWEKIGDILVMRFPDGFAEKRRAARVYGEVLDCRAVLEDIRGIRGVMRQPCVRRLWGDQDTETTHVENGVAFRLDPRRVMFSSGNIDERIRMASIATAGEIVVDLFAGIGYFTLPLAVHSDVRVYACEINPVAAGYLRSSAALNDVAPHVDVRQGDCRSVAPHGVAERVVMGYLKAAPFLPTAMATLHPAGGVLHYHCACSTDDFPGEPMQEVQQAARNAGRSAELSRHRMVKSYAPGVVHGVLDMAIR